MMTPQVNSDQQPPRAARPPLRDHTPSSVDRWIVMPLIALVVVAAYALVVSRGDVLGILGVGS